MKVLIIILCLFTFAAIGLLVVGDLMWLICWAFSLVWSWKLVIGVWAVVMLVSCAVKSSNSK